MTGGMIEPWRQARTIERGWAGHNHIVAEACLFRRNTLVEYLPCVVVVSTIGRLLRDKKICPMDGDIYAESAVFAADGTPWQDADLSIEYRIDGQRYLRCFDVDDWDVQGMHEAVVEEVLQKLRGKIPLERKRYGLAEYLPKITSAGYPY